MRGVCGPCGPHPKTRSSRSVGDPRPGRDQFPALAADEYYWTDLLGLSVRLEDGRVLGTIANMLATGANDVMVVRGERERLIPFVPGHYVKRVDLEARTVIVDWDPDF